MAEHVLMSQDPKDPRWRYRVADANPPATGLIEVVEEELTSASATAQVSGVTNRLLMTPDQARWMLAALAKVLDPEEPPPPSGMPGD